MTRSNGVLRVLQVIQTLRTSYGGPSRNSLDLNGALNSLPLTSAALISVEPPILSDNVANEAEYVQQGRPVPHRVAARRTFIREFLLADVVLIHGYYWIWTAPLAALCVIARKPFLVTPHGALDPRQRRYSKRKKWFFELLFGRILRKASRAVVVGSEAERAGLTDILKREKVLVGGVGTKVPASCRNTRPLQPGRVDLLCLSRIHPKKRIDVAIDCTKYLKDLGFAARLTIAGDGDLVLVTDLKEQIGNLGLADNVSFVGQVAGAGKSQLFTRHDIFLLPSESENFGITLAEALAHGVPAVATDSVAAAAGISPAAGRTISEPNGEELAGAVLELLSTDDFVGTRLAAHRHAQEHYDWAPVAEKWRSILAEASPHGTKMGRMHRL